MGCRFDNFALPLVLAAIVVSANVCQAQLTVLNTTFSSNEGYQDGDLQFQSISDGTVGSWLGHSGATVATAGGGTVTRTGDPRRNLFHRGATGGLAGGDGSGEIIGAGFAVGDRLTVRHAYSFAVTGAPITELLKTGVRPNYANGEFESLPLAGLSLEFVNTGDGELRIYGNMNREASNSSDDPFAMVMNAADIGINNGATGGPPDLESDEITLTWIGEYVGADIWKTREIEVENDTRQVSAMASVVNPASLEQVTVPDSGMEAFFGMQQLQNFSGTGVTHSVEVIYDSILDDIPGDFDGDADVDGSDLLVWQQNTLTINDFIFWRSNYGRTIPGELSGAFIVPEPGGATLIYCGAIASMYVFKLNARQLRLANGRDHQ